MMTCITLENAIRELEKDIYRNADMLDMLYHYLENKSDYINTMKCYYIDNCLVIFIPYSDEDNYTILPNSEYINISLLTQHIISQCEDKKVKISFDLSKTDEMNCNRCLLYLDKKLKKVKSIYGYVKVDSRSVAILNEPNIVHLGVKDKDFVMNFSHGAESFEFRPPFVRLYEIYVTKNQGKILGVYDKNRLVAYLSYFNMFSSLYDVDFIYVTPEYRGKGLGYKLAMYYSEYVIHNGGIPYWSNARNTSSINVALRSGFNICRKLYIYTFGKARIHNDS